MPYRVRACKLTSRLRTRCLAPSSAGLLGHENLGMGKHHQQRFFLGQRQSFALIQLVVAATLSEEALKLHSQRIRLGQTGMVSVGQEVSVELPKILGETFQEVAMGKETWREFLVVAIFMNPAQSQFNGQPVELGRIIAQ